MVDGKVEILSMEGEVVHVVDGPASKLIGLVFIFWKKTEIGGRGIGCRGILLIGLTGGKISGCIVGVLKISAHGKMPGAFTTSNVDVSISWLEL